MFRSAIRSVTRAQPLLRRTYADAVNPDVLTLSLTLPHESLIVKQQVQQVNVPAASGEIGILANHVPIVEELKPGVVEIVESPSKTSQYFISGGLVTVLPGSQLSINAIEAYALDSFSIEAIKSQLSEAQKNLTSADEAIAAEAAIEVEVLEALQQVAK
ncbi:unnamed protein product [Kuraishia capsulata CBS 1993]|uniref:ATP synthase subunit delta, mitochondrial n=1 Tax=Kuraishia capsulata CBS 1993 TaxID=1382522 RepID=W6MMZ0_9ASCO|nr:uncharacterized protein KUCA_T00003556001 [Kuraishia capsulata CBS 1993]CDK27578.1 unnamed protein product [Kuraishia capsulata CBS 1993]